MNFYTLAQKLKKQKMKIYDTYRENGYSKEESETIAKTTIMKDFDSTCTLGIELMERFKNMIPKKDSGHYMITIRPDEKKIKFAIFKTLVEKFVKKKMIIYTYSFEQKGTNPETIGSGFHVHIIGTIRQRDKHTALTQACNFFADCTNPNCIQIDYCKHPEATIQNYLIDYKSEDNHKEITKIGDNIWRNENNLQEIYSNNLSSPGRLLE